MARQCFEGVGCSLGCFAFVWPPRLPHETRPSQVVGLQPQVWLTHSTDDRPNEHDRKKLDVAEETDNSLEDASHKQEVLSERTMPSSTNAEEALWPAHGAFGEVLQVVRDFEDEALREMQEALRFMQDVAIWDDIEERAQEVEGPPPHRGLWQLEKHAQLMGHTDPTSSFTRRSKEKAGTRRVGPPGSNQRGGARRAETPRPNASRPASGNGHGSHGNWLMALQAETQRRQLAKASANRGPNTPRPALIPESLGVSHKTSFDSVRAPLAHSCCAVFLCPEQVSQCVCLEQKSSTVQSCPALGRSSHSL